MELLNLNSLDSNLVDWRLQRQARITQWCFGLAALVFLLMISSLWQWQHQLKQTIELAHKRIQENRTIQASTVPNKKTFQLYTLLMTLQNSAHNVIILKSILINKEYYCLSGWAKSNTDYAEFMREIRAKLPLINLHLKNMFYLNNTAALYFEIEGNLAYAAYSS